MTMLHWEVSRTDNTGTKTTIKQIFLDFEEDLVEFCCITQFLPHRTFARPWIILTHSWLFLFLTWCDVTIVEADLVLVSLPLVAILEPRDTEFIKPPLHLNHKLHQLHSLQTPVASNHNKGHYQPNEGQYSLSWTTINSVSTVNYLDWNLKTINLTICTYSTLPFLHKYTIWVRKIQCQNLSERNIGKILVR